MRNSLENKSIFFALYFEQPIQRQKGSVKFYLVNPYASDIENATLLLKPLSQISDKDAISLGKMVFRDNEITTNTLGYRVLAGMGLLTHFKTGQKIMISAHPATSFCAIDFLRSKGYALPYMDLSVDDLVNYGWITFK